jgi:hypothetical protein
MSNTVRPWLWPDHTIGKRESRELREEHNRAVNDHADAVRVLRDLVDVTRQAAERTTLTGSDLERLAKRIKAAEQQIIKAEGEA